MMKLFGRILCRCFARVVFPEQVAPLRWMSGGINIPKREFVFVRVYAYVPNAYEDNARLRGPFLV
jgi:hypothetical protein